MVVHRSRGMRFYLKGSQPYLIHRRPLPKLGYSPYQRVTDKKYRFPAAWAKAVAENLRRWNFNTVGAWSSDVMFEQEIPYTLILNIGSQAGGELANRRLPGCVFQKNSVKPPFE